MKKILALSFCFALILSSCTKDDEALLTQLQSQKEELENTVKEMPGAADTKASGISFDKDYYWVDAAGSVTIHYTTLQSADVTAAADEGWNVTVSAKSKTVGDIIVTAPDPASPGIITVKAVDDNGNSEDSLVQVFVRKPYGNVASPVIDVHAYFGFSDALATPENFQKLVEAGVTMLTVEGDWEPWLDWRKHCRLAEEYGIKVILFISGSAGNYSSDPANDKTLENKVLEAIQYPAVAAFQIADEPSTVQAYRLAIAKQRIEELAPGYPVYINLHPSTVSQDGMGALTYESYVEYYTRICNFTFITFDQYPLWKWGIEDAWYTSLNVVYKIAHKYGIPFWAFIQSCREYSRIDPTLETIRLQGNVNLAYGAQCNQYFVWKSTSGTDYAPIMDDGTYKPVYDDCKEYDRELHNREFVFARSDVYKVRHYGNDYYMHGACLTKDDLPEAIEDITPGNSALITFVGNSGNEYIVICNKTYLEKLPVEVTFTRNVYTIDREGEFTEQQPGKVSFTIDEGDMLIIKWK